jgi:hypothetical protein
VTSNATVPDRLWWSAARRVALAVLAVLVVASPALAQSAAPTDTAWTHGTTLNVFGGIGVDRSHTAGAAGAALGWEVTRGVAIEGTGTWFERGTGASGFAADLTALVGLRSSGRLVPFAKGGVGMYRTAFDPTSSPMPAFYQERLDPASGFGDRATFTDPTIVAGGGLTVWVGDRVSIRPEVDLKIVIADSSAHPVAATGVRIAYHFADHPRESRAH